MYNILAPLEWNHEKSIKNLEKHGLCFEDASIVLSGNTVTFLDNRYDYGEKRYITLGELEKRIIVLVHTLRVDCIRIISMRKANAREQKIYQKRLKEIR